MRRAILASSLLLSTACQSTLTELVIVADVDASASSIDTVTLDTLDPAGHATTRTVVVRGEGAGALPVTLGVVWRGGALEPMTFTARGLANGAEVVTRRVVTGFVSGQTRVVRLDLFGACIGRTCNDGESCGASGCVAERVAPTDLPRFDGTVIGVGDGGASADASMDDAGRDAAVLDDAAIDAGSASCVPACALDHAVATCTASHACDIASCETGYSNCDDMAATGCERSIRTNTDCNGCNVPCSSTAGTTTCADGSCRIATCASSTTGDCNGELADGCEINLRSDAMHCGSCEHACPTGQRCSAGACH